MIKSEKTDGPIPPDYPYLGTLHKPGHSKIHGTVVLFLEHRKGYVVCSSGEYPVGYYSDAWDTAQFQRYYGVVSLSNA